MVSTKKPEIMTSEAHTEEQRQLFGENKGNDFVDAFQDAMAEIGVGDIIGILT